MTTATSHTESVAPDFAALVAQKACDTISAYFDVRDRSNPWRGQKAALQQSVAEYETRFLIELIQNGYDAIRPRTESSEDTIVGTTGGRLTVELDETEGENGVIYVANSGRPFIESNFDSICEFAQSDKHPGESVGNKGVGFKSTLAVCGEPEICSCAPGGGAGDFDGYCFRFAAYDDVLNYVDGNVQAADEVMRDIGPYFLPVPKFAPEGLRVRFPHPFVTVIRLPLDDDRSLQIAGSELAKLRGNTLPLQLFLAGLKRLDLVVRDEKGPDTTSMRRHPTQIVADSDALLEDVDLEGNGRWLASSLDVPDDELRSAIRASVNAKLLDSRWLEDWKGTATVSIAVRADDGTAACRYYAFLPMGDQSRPAFNGCVNAPFSAKLARTAISETLPLNALFLDVSTHATAQLLMHVAANPDRYPAHVAVDLLAWKPERAEDVADALRAQGLDPLSAPLVPTRGGTYQGLGAVYEWDDGPRAVLTSARITKSCDVDFVADVDDQRVTALGEFAQALGRSDGLKPPRAVIAAWAEAIAERLSRRRFDPRTWESFYGDLGALFLSDPESLRERQILLDQDGKLHRCAPRREEDDAQGAVVFFNQRELAGEERDAPDVKIKGALRRRIVFIHDEIRWLDESRRATPARQLFEGNRLIRPFDRRSLIEHVGRVMRHASSPRTFSEALLFAFAVYQGRSSASGLSLRAARLRVPTRGGWIPAGDAHFSGTWHSSGQTLEQLIDAVGEESAELAVVRDRLLVSNSEFPGGPARTEWVAFLRAAGVRHGLAPQRLDRRRLILEARHVTPENVGRRLGLTASAIERWKEAIGDAGDIQPEGYYKDYEPREGIWGLTGSDDYERFDDAARTAFAMALIQSIGYWPDSCWTTEFVRPGSTERGGTWPTPLSAFVSHAEWLPVVDPADYDRPRFRAPTDAWHFQSVAREEAPTFAPLVEHQVRGLLDRRDQALSRLERLGLKVWNSEAYAVDRLLTMGSLVAENRVPPTNLAFRKAYRDTLANIAAANSVIPLTGCGRAPRHIVVNRGERLAAVRVGDEVGDIYVAERSKRWTSRIVDLMAVDVIWVDRAEEPVARYVGAALGTSVKRASQASVELLVDGQLFEPSPDDPRLLEGREWLAVVVALTLDLKASAFEHRSDSAIRAILDRLAAVRLRAALDVQLIVDEREIALDSTLSDGYPHLSSAGPYLLISAQAASAMTLGELEVLAPSLADTIEVSSLSDPLSLVLVQLGRVVADPAVEPSHEAIARALDTTVDRVVQVESDLRGDVQMVLYVLRPLIATWIGPEAAVSLLENSAGLRTVPDVEGVLRTIAGALPHQPARIIERCLATRNIDQLRDAFGIDYALFNSVLASLGPPYEPRRDVAGHQQAMQWFISEHRDEILGAIREHFSTAFARNESLTDYVALKRLDGLGPDPAWLDAVPRPTEEMMVSRATAWLASKGIDAPLQAPPPAIDVLQAQNRKHIAEAGATLKALIVAWARKNEVAVPTPLLDDDWSHTYTQALGAGGWFDFEDLNTEWLVGRLQRDNLWPPGMLPVASADELGLGADDLDSSRAEAERARRQRERTRRHVELDGREFAVDEDALGALAAAAGDSVAPGFLDSPTTPAELEPLPPRTSRSSSGQTQGKGRSRRETLTDAQKTAVGLVGEVAAFAWLKHHYPALTSAAWKSTYREFVYSDGQGADGLGYDFEVTLARKTLLYEVKSTRSSDRLEFDLGESEVRAAQRAAVHPRTYEYWILYVRNVLDSEARTIDVLPNPFAPMGLQVLRQIGRGLTYQFSLARR